MYIQRFSVQGAENKSMYIWPVQQAKTEKTTDIHRKRVRKRDFQV